MGGAGAALRPDRPSVASYAFCQSPFFSWVSMALSRAKRRALSLRGTPTPYGSFEKGLPTTFSSSGTLAAYPLRMVSSVVTAATW